MRLFYFLRSRGRQAATICGLLLFLGIAPAFSQPGGMVINLAPLDGVALSPENIFSFGIQSTIAAPTEVTVKGTLHYRQSGLSFSYTFRMIIRQGMNRIDAGTVHPQWTFSGKAFEELFRDYHILPQGTYEYCVIITPHAAGGDAQVGEEVQECLYQKVDDLFLINLVDPENNAKLYEHYPVFSWIVNYPFASQLTYRIRVAEIKEGQNTANAIARNNPVYTESNLPQTTTTYPVYGKPLVTFQPYAWTVDAYYKGILLGGAEPWKFTIVEDSELVAVVRDQPYYDFTTAKGASLVIAVGDLKLKYTSSSKMDSLSVMVQKPSDSKVIMSSGPLPVHFADNILVVDCRDKLSHKGRYIATVKSGSGAEYRIPFIYYNPLFIK